MKPYQLANNNNNNNNNNNSNSSKNKTSKKNNSRQLQRSSTASNQTSTNNNTAVQKQRKMQPYAGRGYILSSETVTVYDGDIVASGLQMKALPNGVWINRM